MPYTNLDFLKDLQAKIQSLPPDVWGVSSGDECTNCYERDRLLQYLGMVIETEEIAERNFNQLLEFQVFRDKMREEIRKARKTTSPNRD